MLDLVQRLKLGQCRLLGKYKIEYYNNTLCTNIITAVYHLIKKKIKKLTFFLLLKICFNFGLCTS